MGGYYAFCDWICVPVCIVFSPVIRGGDDDVFDVVSPRDNLIVAMPFSFAFSPNRSSRVCYAAFRG